MDKEWEPAREMERDISVLLISQRMVWLALPGHYGIEIERNLTSALPDQTLQEILFQETLLHPVMPLSELKVWMFTREILSHSFIHFELIFILSSTHMRQFHQNHPALKFYLQFCHSYVILACSSRLPLLLSSPQASWVSEKERERERWGLILMQYLILDVQQVIKLIIETFRSHYPSLPGPVGN